MYSIYQNNKELAKRANKIKETIERIKKIGEEENNVIDMPIVKTIKVKFDKINIKPLEFTYAEEEEEDNE